MIQAGGILLLNQSASGVDVGSAIVFEEGTDDGAKHCLVLLDYLILDLLKEVSLQGQK